MTKRRCGAFLHFAAWAHSPRHALALGACLTPVPGLFGLCSCACNIDLTPPLAPSLLAPPRR